MAQYLVSSILGPQVMPGGVSAPTSVGPIAMPHTTGPGFGALDWARGAVDTMGTIAAGAGFTLHENAGHPTYKQNDRVVWQYYGETVVDQDRLFAGVPVFALRGAPSKSEGTPRSPLKIFSLAALNHVLRSEPGETPASVLLRYTFLGIFVSDSLTGNHGERREDPDAFNPGKKHVFTVIVDRVGAITPWWGTRMSHGSEASFVVMKVAPSVSAGSRARARALATRAVGAPGAAAAGARAFEEATAECCQIIPATRGWTAAHLMERESLDRDPDVATYEVGICVDPAARRLRLAEMGLHVYGEASMVEVGEMRGLDMALHVSLNLAEHCADPAYYRGTA